MSYCLNPTCQKPNNPIENNFCQSCGSKLLLKERYRAIAPIGAGGFGRTFRAVDEHRLNDTCVIKQFLLLPRENRKATELFNQEAMRLYELGKHPQIPDLLAHFEQDERLYLVQEFIGGETLLKELEQKGGFNEKQIRELLADLLPVLHFIHERGVIHRDIKPENIMRRCLDGKLVLIDFGVSKQLTGTHLSQVATTVGTPGYASLEQMRGQPCPASDLYSLGVTCVGLLTQCLPTESGSNQVYDALSGHWVWREHLPQGTTISTELGQILDQLLKEFVKERYQSADAVLQALNQGEIPAAVINNPARNYSPNPVINLFPLPSPVTLLSAVGVDYSKLRDLLAAGKWREADEETMTVMLKVSGRKKQGWLDLAHIRQFPCEDLCTIDQLWAKYSNGKFGFSVQRRIWESVSETTSAIAIYETWKRFSESVGWYGDKSWKNYSDLTFTLYAPEGHFPGGVFMLFQGYGCWLQRLSTLAGRLESCNIQ